MTVHDFERDEWRAALHTQSEMARAHDCRHDYGGTGICCWCGDDEPRRNRD